MTEASDKPPIDHAFTGDRRGGAADPTYAGALSFMRRRYGKDVAGSDLVIWGVPFDLSVTNRPGTRFGPQAIRRASAIFDGDPQYPSGIDPFARLLAMDYGDCALPRGDLGACARAIETAVSYTHLDVYKRQVLLDRHEHPDDVAQQVRPALRHAVEKHRLGQGRLRETRHLRVQRVLDARDDRHASPVPRTLLVTQNAACGTV